MPELYQFVMIRLFVLNQKIGVKRHCCLCITLVRFGRKYSMLHHNNICFSEFRLCRFIVSCLNLYVFF
jgi:hypothetical protein